MSAQEFVGWMAYAQLEPFGERQADWRAGMIASTIANVNRGPHTKAYQPGDFMPQYEPQAQPEPHDWQAVKASMLLWHEALGGKGVSQ